VTLDPAASGGTILAGDIVTAITALSTASAISGGTAYIEAWVPDTTNGYSPINQAAPTVIAGRVAPLDALFVLFVTDSSRGRIGKGERPRPSLSENKNSERETEYGGAGAVFAGKGGDDFAGGRNSDRKRGAVWNDDSDRPRRENSL